MASEYPIGIFKLFLKCWTIKPGCASEKDNFTWQHPSISATLTLKNA
jgi:hypothetical protein